MANKKQKEEQEESVTDSLLKEQQQPEEQQQLFTDEATNEEGNKQSKESRDPQEYGKQVADAAAKTEAPDVPATAANLTFYHQQELLKEDEQSDRSL